MARILIAEDSEVMRQQLATMINGHAGWTVCGEATNGVSTILKAHELKPDLIIIDLVMPMLDGLQASAEVAKLHPSIPIVIYSLQILPELEMEAKKYGVWALVSKSADQSLLVETVERLLDASQQQLQLNASGPHPNESSSTVAHTSTGGPLDAESVPKPPAEPD
jgi:DNA-binding NarL/FixJ family response regulator